MSSTSFSLTVDGGRKLDAVAERSRRPLSSPNALPVEIEDLAVESRRQVAG